MAFLAAGGGPSNPAINVTPVIDVLLVLIIIFVLVVSMSEEKGLEAQLPQPQHDPSKHQDLQRTIVVQILARRDPDQIPS
jgi:biopolymer transport protein TolR